jgi:RNA polymerase sigma-70 factor, ECF subfamily
VIDAAQLAAARAAWPGVVVDDAAFTAWVTTRLAPSESPSQLHLGDLYLACACAAGDATAIAALERSFLVDVPRWLARMDGGDAFADEVRQQLRERLLTGERPRIASYAGRGPLRSWLHVAALRVASNARRGDRPLGESGDLPLAEPDPELRLLQQRYKEQFRDAFAAAVAALGVGERQLLRLHFLDGVALGQIGALYGCDKSTVSRKLSAARQTLFEETRRRLRAQLRLTEAELTSLMRLVRSQLHDLSITRLLRDAG